MKATISQSPIGIFAFSEGELIYYKLFSKNPEKAVEEFGKTQDDFISQLTDYEIVEDENKALRKNFREYAINLGFASNDKELNEFLSDFFRILSEKKLKGVIGKDRILVQANNALEEINRNYHLFCERLSEWYSLHYPELRINQKELADLIIKYGSRNKFPDFKDSSGVELSENDIEILRSYALLIKQILEQKNRMEKYLKELSIEVMPNTSSLIDPLLAAKLLALAGSLEKLSKMTSSTIQLLGAEKALFRHLHKKGKSPKYGIIFLDSRIQSAKDKGKVARILASHLMKSVRIDYFSKRDESKKLKKELEKEIKAMA